MPGDAVFLDIQGSPQDQVRHLALDEGQAHGAAPFGILDLDEIHVDAGLLLQLLIEPHGGKIHGDILDLILQGGQRHRRRLEALGSPRGAGSGQQQGRGQQQADELNGSVS